MTKRRVKKREVTRLVGPAWGRDPEEDGNPPSSERPSLEDEIRLRAYYRYLQGEGESGDAITDWLEAEADVLGRHAAGLDARGRSSDEEAGLD
jgi:hypothetical protein